jgi:predicted TIM-barrel fold metal-dependent hydrolase
MADVIDMHTHAYPEKVACKAVEFLNNYYHVQCQGTGRMKDLLSSAADAGVDYLLVHAVATKPSQVENVNSWIARHLSDHVFGFGSIHPDYPDIPRELRRIQSLGLRGVKLHPDFQEFYADSPAMFPVYKMLEGVMPVLFHAGDENSDYSSPKRIANVAEHFPGLTIIAAHLGGYSQWDEAEKYVIGKNVYLDTSSSLFKLPRERAVEIIRRHGAERVLFGTDYPLTRHREELTRFRALGLTEEEERLILFENARKLLHLAI